VLEDLWMRRLPLAIVLLVTSGVCASSDATELSGEAMLRALKDGGYVVYLRHDRTDTSRSDTDPIDLSDCAKQRPLSDAGRAHARTIGLAFKAIHIPVDQVLSSPVCRSAETAMLAFPDAKRAAPHALVYTLALPKEELGPAADELRKMLATPPRTGTNTVLVGHTTNLKEATDLWPKHEGGALIFRPDGHGGFALAGSIDPAEFERASNGGS
jgi:phosphohistidine phosphatase SixA